MAFQPLNTNGQKTMANSSPVVIASDQSAIPVTETVTDTAPATQNITVIDSSSATSTGANNQTIVIGTPTAGSAASFALSGIETVRVEVTGIWTGTLTAEVSIDGGTTWTSQGLHQGAYTTSSFTAGFIGGGNVAGATNFRMRATAAITGTAVVKIIESVNTQSVYIANAAPSGTVISVNNSSTATLTSGSVYTGTGEDVTNFSEMRISVISNVASATDGLSIQQSPDNTNWDITDTYTIPAATGKTFVVPRQARYFRIVYTNGGTNQGSFRLQSILNRTATAPSSNRASDGYTNETDLVQNQVFLMGYNGTTWDRLRSTGTGILNVLLSAGSAVIGHVITDTGSTTAVTGNVTVVQPTGTSLHAVLDTTSTTAVTQATAANLNATVIGAGTAGTANAGVVTVQGIASMTKLLVTPDSVALPANQSVNVAQLAGTTTDTNSGTKSAGTLRVVLATDQPQLTNKLLVTPDSVALPANQSVNMAQFGGTNVVTGGVAGVQSVGGNVANGVTATTNPVPVGGVFTTAPTTLTTGQTATLQFTAAQNVKNDTTTLGGTAIDTNSGNKSAGTQRMVLATDQPNLTTALNVALAANQSVNVAQINGVTPLMGNGTTGTGSQRVTIASDNTAFTVNPASATVPVSTMNSASANSGVNSAMAAVFDDVSPTAITENSFGFVRMSANRNQYTTIRDAAGNERGQNVNANNAALIAVDQTTVGTTNAVSLAQIGATTVLTGNGTAGAGAQRVTIASDNTANSNPWLVTQTPATSGGLSVYHLASTATTNLQVPKASAGQLYGYMVSNTSAAYSYLCFHNSASTPTAGASIFFKIGIPAGGAANVSFDSGLAFSTGIAISTVTGAADNNTTAVALNDLIINLFYK